MLPFPDKNKRKWICFCCGESFDDFAGMKLHIVDNHEEGRDYVICPLNRCEAPVRDLKTHFKVKHPHNELPKINSLYRALIWKDFSGNKLKNRKPKFRQGSIISEKNNGKEIKYRSGYECEIYECLEILPDVVKYDAEPLKIPYTFKGKQKTYIPDISVFFSDQHIEIWEIKPENQKSLDINKAKWAAANNFCELRGWTFKVLTETEIEILKGRIRKFS